MTVLSRRVWADLRVAHPDVDPANPTDEFAMALIAATGGDPDVWVTGGEAEALRAYERALRCTPDHTWARTLLDTDPTVAVEVSVCVDMGISWDEFLTWPARSQDLAIATVLKRRDTCPSGRHPREAMRDPDAVTRTRVFCRACADDHDLDQRFENAPADMRVGWTTETRPR